MKQGSCVAGARSNKLVVLGAIARPGSDLAAPAKKVFNVSSHLGVAISGLAADARILVKYMQGECLNYSFVYAGDMPVSRLVAQIADSNGHKL